MSKKCDTGKFCFISARLARRSHRKSTKSFRIRVYRCPSCSQYHITNSEKAHPGKTGKQMKSFKSPVKRRANDNRRIEDFYMDENNEDRS